MDFIISVDHYKNQLPEVELFYGFFMSNYTTKDLLFYLYMRSLGEKESGVIISRMATGDIR